MKILYILIVYMFISCGQKPQEESPSQVKKPIIVNAQDAVSAQDAVDAQHGTESPIENATRSFNDIIGAIKTKITPLIDSTNYDNFVAKKFYNKDQINTLKLLEIYPNFFKEGYNYKATDSYKIEMSGNFYTVVLTIFKGDHEMESVLINYSFKGEIIDSKVISYDESAEGWSKIKSKIDKNIITVNAIKWIDKKEVETTRFRIVANGKIKPLSNQELLLDSVMKQLNLEYSSINADLLVYRVNPNNPEETLVVIPEYVDLGNEVEHVEHNSHILIVNTKSHHISHKFFESFKTNGWTSDAIELREITIDTARYKLTEGTRAFGIRVFHFGNSRANPSNTKRLSLFVKSGKALKKVLHNYEVMQYWGEWDTTCYGEFVTVESTLSISKNKTNEYYDILVQNKITETKNDEDKNGECISNDAITNREERLYFNGEKYLKDDCAFSPLEVYANDDDPKGATIRNDPKGEVVLNLSQQGYYSLTIDEINEGWLKVVQIDEVEADMMKIPGGTGWIHNSEIAATTIRKVQVFDAPKNGVLVGMIEKTKRIKIIDICSGWVKVAHNGLIGWIESKWICGNPVTKCR